MLNQIKSLLNDAQLQQQIKQAASSAEVIKLVMTASAAKGYNVSKDAVSQALTSLMFAESNQLSEADLLSVAGAGGRTFPEGAPLSNTDCCHLN